MICLPFTQVRSRSLPSLTCSSHTVVNPRSAVSRIRWHSRSCHLNLWDSNIQKGLLSHSNAEAMFALLLFLSIISLSSASLSDWLKKELGTEPTHQTLKSIWLFGLGKSRAQVTFPFSMPVVNAYRLFFLNELWTFCIPVLASYLSWHTDKSCPPAQLSVDVRTKIWN